MDLARVIGKKTISIKSITEFVRLEGTVLFYPANGRQDQLENQ